MRTPRRLLRSAIIEMLTPAKPANPAPNQNSAPPKRRARVQDKTGEILTDESVLERLREEEIDRKNKKPRKGGNKTIHKPKAQRNLDFYFNKASSSNQDKNAKAKVIQPEDSDVEMLSDDNFPNSSESIKKLNPKDLRVNSYVIFQYESSYFLGVVSKLNKRTISISCMTKSSPATWKWPEPAEVDDYPVSDVIQIIQAPKPFNNRGQLSVPEIDKYWLG